KPARAARRSWTSSPWMDRLGDLQPPFATVYDAFGQDAPIGIRSVADRVQSNAEGRVKLLQRGDHTVTVAVASLRHETAIRIFVCSPGSPVAARARFRCGALAARLVDAACRH